MIVTTDQPVVTLIWPDHSPRGVLYQEDIEDLCQDYTECHALWEKIKSPDLPQDELARLLKEELPCYRSYEAVDGRLHPLDLLQAPTIEELRNDPSCVLPLARNWDFAEGQQPLPFVTGEDVKGVYLPYDLYASHQARTEAGKEQPGDFDVVVWLGWPQDGPRPNVGVTSETFDNQDRQRRKAAALSRLADRGKFECDSGAAIANVDPTWEPGLDDDDP